MAGGGGDVAAREEAGLDTGVAARLLFRSFFLQAAWSYERMQSVGFASILGGCGRGFLKPEDRAAFLVRHLEYFNTNPVLASYAIGGVLRIEERVARGEEDPREVTRFKRALVGPLAAWGDTLFWATLRPVAAAAGAATALVAGGWGVLAYLLVYNVPHFHYRWRGLGEGYRLGMDLGPTLSRSPLRTLPVRIRRAGLLTLGFAAAFTGPGTVSEAGTAGFLGILAATAGVFFMLKKKAGLGGSWGGLAVLAGLAQVWGMAGR